MEFNKLVEIFTTPMNKFLHDNRGDIDARASTSIDHSGIRFPDEALLMG